MPQKNIIVKGAREHNLKNVDVEIPRDKLVVFTGLSGSGKSSLAFDTIYAEGQRRYVESLSSYARQFLGQMEKPQVDYIEGLSPAISIDQKTTSKNPRSTVGTVTEIYDYLRLLYARIGIPHCPVCGREISRQTVDDIVDSVLELPEGTRIQVMAPIARGKKGQFVKELESAKKDGYVRVRVDGIIYDLSEKIELDKNKKHNIEIVVDRLVVKESIRSRLADSIETATGLSDGILLVDVIDGQRSDEDGGHDQAGAGDDRAAESALCEADIGCGVDADRTRRHLGDRHQISERVRRNDSAPVDKFRDQQRNENIAAAEADQPEFEEGPEQCEKAHPDTPLRLILQVQ